MGKATKKKSKHKFLAEEEQFITSISKEPVTEQNYSKLCVHREDLLKRLKKDKVDHVLHLKSILSVHEIELCLNIQRILLQYNTLIQEWDIKLHSNAFLVYDTRDEHALEILEDYV